MYVCVYVCMYVCMYVPYDLKNGWTDFGVQYIKLTGIIPGVSWATLFSEKNIRKGPKTTKIGPTWLTYFPLISRLPVTCLVALNK